MREIEPIGTICYRLLVEPMLGNGLGNTVYIGLDVQDAKERSNLRFSGLPKRVDAVRRALDVVRIFDGDRFNTKHPATAEELWSAICSPRVQLFEPLLVRGQEILDQLKAPT